MSEISRLVLSVKLVVNTIDELPKGIYLSVLTKGLKVVNIPKTNSNFWAYMEIKTYPYIPTNCERTRHLSIKLLDENGGSLLKEEDLNEITKRGNLVFIHPDS